MATRQEVIFKLGNEEYGLDIMKVYGIERYQKITKVPNTPEYIEGIINLRGEVYPIYNLRKKFHMPEKAVDDETKMIIVNSNEMMVGFIVDSVVEIRHIDEDNIKPAPKLISGIDRRYIIGVGEVDDRMIIILDVDLILEDEEKETVSQIINQAE
ncbi:MAG TPA: chemotaxis protein CheW [Defluviitaleaceae bacterium]|nr:purine-binding chemotaxis protein CheW [Candidatus Epulonipiscium sp.]HOQ17040.1 chemotaxis protein CheW [Defluviitaleaceae bacterium]HPT75478.1 chemotaxis protein CheW [Defluviitaleaceae bacterium]HQD51518.1 chemotaxis protein CheW [Defluviitaleaceae bacterium]